MQNFSSVLCCRFMFVRQKTLTMECQFYSSGITVFIGFAVIVVETLILKQIQFFKKVVK